MNWRLKEATWAEDVCTIHGPDGAFADVVCCDVRGLDGSPAQVWVVDVIYYEDPCHAGLEQYVAVFASFDALQAWIAGLNSKAVCAP